MLGRNEILKQLELGNIVIDPFNEKQLGPNSYDICLGEYFYRQKIASLLSHYLVEERIITVSSIWDTNEIQEKDYFLIKTQEYVLASTKERIGAQNGYSTLLLTRSTVGRQGVQVCASAGLGDVGFINIWTLMIHNISQQDLYLPINMRIAQIVFFKVEGADVKYSGGYKQQEKWEPSQMLPKLGKERF